MAGRPLRPATDRRLGGPSPRQQANQAQAPPAAPGPKVPGFRRAPPCARPHAALPPLSGRYSPLLGRSPTRCSPVRHARCRASDLHVLSTPPAFILSQDQTLVLKIPAAPGKHSGPPETPIKSCSLLNYYHWPPRAMEWRRGSSKAPIIPYPAPRGAWRGKPPAPSRPPGPEKRAEGRPRPRAQTIRLPNQKKNARGKFKRDEKIKEKH